MTSAGLAIPPLPAARARALPLMLRQDVALAELAAAIESDPALAGALLRAANSAASSPRDRVDSAAAALVRLGLDPARQIGFWDAVTAGNFLGSADVADEVFGGQGTYTVTDADLDLNA